MRSMLKRKPGTADRSESKTARIRLKAIRSGVVGSAPKMRRSFWFALISLLIVTAAVAQERAVQLLLPSRQLEPTSTFELRFANEMVPADQLGKVVAASPLVFAPPIEGQFIWLSSRSGTFAPKGVLPLGTKYQISLRPGLKDAAGRALTATLKETAETPPMRVKGVNSLVGSDEDDAPAMPRLLVLFNANVKAEACAKFFRFVNAAGAKVEARVEQSSATKGDRAFPSYQSDDRSLSVWGEPPPAASEVQEFSEEEEDKAKPAPPRKNILSVSPAKPLMPGKDWKLVIESGLPAAEGKVALPARREILIGTVKPFEVSSAAAESNRIAGRRIIVEFSKALAEEVTPETVLRWISITPAPEGLKAELEVGDKTVTLKGKFELGVKYSISVKAGLPARQPFKLERAQTREGVFKEIAPRLYFEGFATHQHLSGTRRFRLLSVNVPRIRVTARLFTGDTTPVAVKAYDHYDEYSDLSPPDEMYHRVDVEKLPGKIIWERELTPSGGVDQPQTLPLNWDEILAEQKTGAVLLTAESVEPVTEGKKRVGTQAVVQLTDLGAVWKRDQQGALALHIFSLANGQGLAGVKLRLLDLETKQMENGEAVTDKEGNAKLPPADEARWVFAEHAGDGHLISLRNSDAAVPLYRLGVTESEEGGGEAQSVFLFTERGVYKPGDVVHLKGFARDLDGERSSLPAGKTLTVTMTDAKGEGGFQSGDDAFRFRFVRGGNQTYRGNAR